MTKVPGPSTRFLVQKKFAFLHYPLQICDLNNTKCIIVSMPHCTAIEIEGSCGQLRIREPV